MRLSDVLRQDEDHKVCNTTKKKKNILPSRWQIISRYLRFRSLFRCQSSNEQEALAIRDENSILPPELPLEEEGGRNPMQRSDLSIGIGAGLALLLTRSSSEFKKMMDLRKEMESLMEECKAVLQRDLSCRGSSSETKNNPHSWNETEQTKSNLSFAGSERRRISLEAELESELEILQINLESEEENIDEEAHMENTGVSPRALAGKLHELLERRQQERIDVLESALELALAKIKEKEMEISLWRETARVASQRSFGRSAASADA